MKGFISINPADESQNASFDFDTENILSNKIQNCYNSFKNWKKLSFSERGKCFIKLAELLETRKDILANIITQEMGKPLSEAVREVSKCARVCIYFAENAEKLLKPVSYPEADVKHKIIYQPLGVLFGIFPWNFPFWQVFRSGAPAMMAGNVMLVKHAMNVPLSAIEIEKLFLEAGFPDGTYTNIFIANEDAASVIADDRIAAVTLTGSERAGSSVASAAGKAIKVSVLELGGSDAFIVLNDADIDKAVQTAVTSRFGNAGQSCNAAKRLILHDKIADAFTAKLVEKVKSLSIGDPLKADVSIGPLARKDLLENIEEQVKRSVELGAKILCGGRKVSGRGYYFEPTVLINIPASSPAYSEELFGPVISVFKFTNIHEAIELANDTRFGLDASVWTSNLNAAEEIAEQLEVGQVYINSLVRSMAELPFGGSKKSGFGRELGRNGILEFVNPKTVVFE